MKDIRKQLQASLRLLTVLIFGIVAAASYAEKVEDLPKPTDYVTDLAHVLSPEAIARIDRISKQLETEADAQIAVVTVRTMDGDDAADFATRIFEKYKIGKKGTDKGVLIFLSVDDHKYFISTGSGVQGYLTDGRTGDIGRAMVPLLRAGDYDGAVLSSVSAVATAIATDAKVTLDQSDLEAAPAPERQHESMSTVKLIFIIIFVILFIIFRILRFFGRAMTGGWWGSGPFIGGGYGGGGGGGSDFGGGGGSDFGGFGGGGTDGGGAGGSW